ncbi:hypothetical protein [Pseudoalteromonas luteoviolacea]|uniref:hypothetical protein n=1 Tax=Pseudoalteromonas luteoviolacea TaxID=43657 RepID=UPI001B35DCB6|nr:hypothetical protein [Pseudoalteromonas luteoviolacea]MBQ4837826.1 hypothetical protein [Pseudoalteromonas luteoviolacea]
MKKMMLSTIVSVVVAITSYSAHSATTVSAWGGAEHLNYDTARGGGNTQSETSLPKCA